MGESNKKKYVVDKNSPVPLYYQLKENILKFIEDEKLQPGSPIPSEHSLIANFGVSRTTVRQALSELVNEGVLETQRGRGTFLAKTEINLKSLEVQTSFNPQIIAKGMTPSTKVIDLRVETPAREVQKMLKLNDDEKVVYVNRLRLADDNPVALVASYHPYPLCEKMLTSDFENTSLYDILNSSEDSYVTKLTRRITAIKANRQDANLLGIKIGAPIQYFVSLGINKYDKPVDLSYSKYVGERSYFSVDVPIPKRQD